MEVQCFLCEVKVESLNAVLTSPSGKPVSILGERYKQRHRQSFLSEQGGLQMFFIHQQMHLFISLRGLLHVSVYDHHQGAYVGILIVGTEFCLLGINNLYLCTVHLDTNIFLFTKGCTHLLVLESTKIYIKFHTKMLLHISVYDHHQGACT